MRKGILGLLAYCLTGLELAQGQTSPAYQEPLPIQVPGVRFGAYAAPVPVAFPNYTPPAPIQAHGSASRYALPMGWRPNAELAAQRPISPRDVDGYDPALVRAAAQDNVPRPKLPAPKGAEKQPELLKAPARSTGVTPQGLPLQVPSSLLPKGAAWEPELPPGGTMVEEGPPEPAEPYMVGAGSTPGTTRSWKAVTSSWCQRWLISIRPFRWNR